MIRTRHQLLVLLLAGLCFLTSSLTASAEETKSNPQADPKTAVAHALKLMEKKEYKQLMQTMVVPEQLEKILERVPLEKLVEGFSKKKSERLLKALQAASKLEPTYNKQMTEATFQFEDPIDGKSSIAFRKVDNLWYLSN